MKQLIPVFSGPGVSASPGVCYLCNSDKRQSEPGIISTGKWIEMEGFIEICCACNEEMGSLHGMVSSTKADELRNSNRSLGRTIGHLEKKLRGYNTLRDLIKDLTEGE